MAPALGVSLRRFLGQRGPPVQPVGMPDEGLELAEDDLVAATLQAAGAFVEIIPGKDGLCHISELAEGYVASVADECKVGDEMDVKVIAIDDQDRVKLSRRAAIKEASGDDGEKEEADQAEE